MDYFQHLMIARSSLSKIVRPLYINLYSPTTGSIKKQRNAKA